MKRQKFWNFSCHTLYIVSFIISTADFTRAADSSLLKVPNFCNDCSKAGCLHDGKCRLDDGRCDCQPGYWGNRCQYKFHDMYKFGQCPIPEALGKLQFDWPQLQPDGCQFDSDCPGLWKCCPSFVATEGHKDRHAATGTRSCTQPYLDPSYVQQLPLCLQHLWNITDSGRSFSGCDVLMCDESTGGRAFDRWQCNYCDASSTTCFCFINFDNEGKYWGELPGSRQRLALLGDETTHRPGVIHRMPKHDCSLQDRCPQMFPHSIYCSHGIQRDSSGCPTGECLPNPEEKCFTSCSSGFLCEHRPEPEQVNHWHCMDTFRQYRVTVPISSRLARVLSQELANISAKAAELVASSSLVDESILSLMNQTKTLPCNDPESLANPRSNLKATTAASAYLLPLQGSGDTFIIEIVGQVAFSANFSGQVVRRQLQKWLNETYGLKAIEEDVMALRQARPKSALSAAALASIIVICVVILLGLLAAIPMYIYRRKLFKSNKFSFNSADHHQSAAAAAAGHHISQQTASRDVGHMVFSAFTNPRYGASAQQTSKHINTAAKSRPAPVPPVVMISSSAASSSSGSSVDGSLSPKHDDGEVKENNVTEGYEAF